MNEDDSLKGLDLVDSSDKLEEKYEAWFKLDGKFVCGKLADVLNAAAKQKTDTVTLSAKNITGIRKVEKAALKQLSGIALKPSDENYQVKISLENPEGKENPETIELKDLSNSKDDETADLYIWLSKPQENNPEESAEPEPAQTPEPALSVAV